MQTIKVIDPYADLIVKKFHKTTLPSRKSSPVSKKKKMRLFPYNYNLKDLEE